MGMGLNSGPDLKHFLNATRSLTSAIFVASRMLAHGRNVVVHGRGTRLVNGNALAARLLRTALDRRIPLWPSSRAVSLVNENGRVAGAIVEKQGKEIPLMHGGSGPCGRRLSAGCCSHARSLQASVATRSMRRSRRRPTPETR